MKLRIDRKTFLRKLLSVLVGDAISAFALVFFLKPNQMIAGGIEGLSVIIEHLTGIPLGLLVLVLNLPLLIVGIFLLDKEFSFFTAISIFVLSGYISLFEFLKPEDLAITKNIVLACLYGGCIRGVGAGILFRNGTSAGGLDIVGAIMKKHFNISIGNMLLILNCFIVGVSAFIYSVDRALFTLVALFISYQVIDKLQLGVGRQKQVLVISEKSQEISNKIQSDVLRGVTFLDGEGAYENHKFKILYIICTSRELVKVKNIVKEIDPQSFLTVSDTSEIQGQGFRKIEIWLYLKELIRILY